MGARELHQLLCLQTPPEIRAVGAPFDTGLSVIVSKQIASNGFVL